MAKKAARSNSARALMFRKEWIFDPGPEFCGSTGVAGQSEPAQDGVHQECQRGHQAGSGQVAGLCLLDAPAYSATHHPSRRPRRWTRARHFASRHARRFSAPGKPRTRLSRRRTAAMATPSASWTSSRIRRRSSETAQEINPVLIGFSLIFQFYVDRYGELVPSCARTASIATSRWAGTFPA